MQSIVLLVARALVRVILPTDRLILFYKNKIDLNLVYVK